MPPRSGRASDLPLPSFFSLSSPPVPHVRPGRAAQQDLRRLVVLPVVRLEAVLGELFRARGAAVRRRRRRRRPARGGGGRAPQPRALRGRVLLEIVIVSVVVVADEVVAQVVVAEVVGRIDAAVAVGLRRDAASARARTVHSRISSLSLSLSLSRFGCVCAPTDFPGGEEGEAFFSLPRGRA
jgi:hypothetical protein